MAEPAREGSGDDPLIAKMRQALEDVLRSELGRLGDQLKTTLKEEVHDTILDIEKKLKAHPRGPPLPGSPPPTTPLHTEQGWVLPAHAASPASPSGQAPARSAGRPMAGYLSQELQDMMEEESEGLEIVQEQNRLQMLQQQAEQRRSVSMEMIQEQSAERQQSPGGLAGAASSKDTPSLPTTESGPGSPGGHPFGVAGLPADAPALLTSEDGGGPVMERFNSQDFKRITEGGHLGPLRSATSTFRSKNNLLWHKKLKLFVNGQIFEAVVSLMIFLSAAHVGIQTDYMCRNLTDAKLPPVYRVFDIIFMCFFTVELGFRLIVHRWTFFSMRGRLWNMFDLLLVVGQMFEEAIGLITSGNKNTGLPSAFLLRIIRVLRCVRTIRLLQVMRFADELRLLVSCIMHSLKAFSWSLALIMMMIYMASVYFALGVQLYRVEQINAPVNSEAYLASVELEALAGNVPLAMLSLFQALTGGMDWNDMAKPMMDHVAWWWGIIFFFYVSFMLFAVLNVVTAIFVENAIERSESVKQVQKMNKASRLFKSLDLDGSGQITCDEIMNNLESQQVQEFFRSINVHTSEAKALFDLLDNDGGDGLDFQEFIGGCMRLQGPARSVDLVKLLSMLNKHS